VSLCYESANVEFEKLNFNLKSCVLSIIQSVMSDLNSISNIQETNVPKKSILLKKIIMPLMGTSRSETSQSNSIFGLPFGFSGSSFLSGFTGINSTPQSIAPLSSASNTTFSSINTLFDNDFRFQKFIVFIVDFIHIIYDKISDQPINDTSYDVNDELSIFSFAILTHSLSLGLVCRNFTKLWLFSKN